MPPIGCPSNGRPGNTCPGRQTKDAASRRTSATSSAAAADRSRLVDTAASCSTGQGTAHRNCYTDSRTAARRARNTHAGNAPADKRTNQNRAARRFRDPAGPAGKRQRPTLPGKAQTNPRINPKAELRRPKEGRRTEIRTTHLRRSEFEIQLFFGFRPSDFGFRSFRCSRPTVPTRPLALQGGLEVTPECSDHSAIGGPLAFGFLWRIGSAFGRRQ